MFDLIKLYIILIKILLIKLKMNYILWLCLAAFFISVTDICNKSLINDGVSNFKYTF